MNTLLIILLVAIVLYILFSTSKPSCAPDDCEAEEKLIKSAKEELASGKHTPHDVIMTFAFFIKLIDGDAYGFKRMRNYAESLAGMKLEDYVEIHKSKTSDN
jgi:hypothetical protein